LLWEQVLQHKLLRSPDLYELSETVLPREEIIAYVRDEDNC
jgi:hypothetical protein